MVLDNRYLRSPWVGRGKIVAEMDVDATPPIAGLCLSFGKRFLPFRVVPKYMVEDWHLPPLNIIPQKPPDA